MELIGVRNRCQSVQVARRSGQGMKVIVIADLDEFWDDRRRPLGPTVPGDLASAADVEFVPSPIVAPEKRHALQDVVEALPVGGADALG
jgi:hypothetical protein